MSTTSVGRQAEAIAADYLKNLGYDIYAQNWRTRWCEIDIVAVKDQVVYFVEVKYRKSDVWGSGLEYITKKKLQQMHFAAAFWVSAHDWQGDYSLSALEVSGPQFVVSNFEAEV